MGSRRPKAEISGLGADLNRNLREHPPLFRRPVVRWGRRERDLPESSPDPRLGRDAHRARHRLGHPLTAVSRSGITQGLPLTMHWGPDEVLEAWQ
jgi:hypothetical protein